MNTGEKQPSYFYIPPNLKALFLAVWMENIFYCKFKASLARDPTNILTRKNWEEKKNLTLQCEQILITVLWERTYRWATNFLEREKLSQSLQHRHIQMPKQLCHTASATQVWVGGNSGERRKAESQQACLAALIFPFRFTNNFFNNNPRNSTYFMSWFIYSHKKHTIYKRQHNLTKVIDILFGIRVVSKFRFCHFPALWLWVLFNFSVP